jgi:hypothetical protein
LYLRPISLALALLSAQGAPSAQEPATDAEKVRNYRQRPHPPEWLKWFSVQRDVDCFGVQRDDRAIAAVERALSRVPRPGGIGRRWHPSRTRRNWLGKGTLVFALADRETGMGADFQRERAVWLYLDGRVHPVNDQAKDALGTRDDDMSPAVRNASGFKQWSFEREAQLANGIPGFESQSYRRNSEGWNPFPHCQ